MTEENFYHYMTFLDVSMRRFSIVCPLVIKQCLSNQNIMNIAQNIILHYSISLTLFCSVYYSNLAERTFSFLVVGLDSDLKRAVG